MFLQSLLQSQNDVLMGTQDLHSLPAYSLFLKQICLFSFLPVCSQDEKVRMSLHCVQKCLWEKKVSHQLYPARSWLWRAICAEVEKDRALSILKWGWNQWKPVHVWLSEVLHTEVNDRPFPASPRPPKLPGEQKSGMSAEKTWRSLSPSPSLSTGSKESSWVSGQIVCIVHMWCRTTLLREKDDGFTFLHYSGCSWRVSAIA